MKKHKWFVVVIFVQLIFVLSMIGISLRPGENVYVSAREIKKYDAFSLKPGAYEYAVRYSGGGAEDSHIDIVSPERPSCIRHNYRHLTGAGNECINIMWVNTFFTKVECVIVPSKNNEDDLYIEGVWFTEKTSYRFARILGIAVLLVLADAAYACIFISKNIERRNTAASLAAIFIFSSLPLFAGYIYYGHDLSFHMNRISELADAIRCGYWTWFIQPHMLNGYGYATPIFYPQFFLYLPAVLVSLYVPISVAYNIYVICVNAAACLVAYYSFGRMFDDRRAGIMGTLFYVLSIYRMINVYTRVAVGEYTAMIFLPLVMYGFCNIYGKSAEDLRFADALPVVFGLTGIIQSHILTIEMTGIFIFIFCLMKIKQTFNIRRFVFLALAALLTFALNIGVITVLICGFKMNVYISGGVTENIGKNGLYPVQLLSFFGNAAAFNLDNTWHEMWFGVGADILLGIGMLLWLAINRDVLKVDKDFGYGRTMTAFKMFIIAIMLSLYFFPWDTLDIFGKKTEGLLSSVQFPWRFLLLGTLLGVYVLLGTCELLERSRGINARKMFSALLVIFTIVPVGYFYGSFIYDAEPKYYNSQYDLDYDEIGGWEYLPRGTNKDATENTEVITGSEYVTVRDYGYDGGVTSFWCGNEGWDSYVDIPMLNYNGYCVYDDSGNFLTPEIGKDMRIRIYIPSGYADRINIRYRVRTLWKVAWMASVCVFAGIIAAYGILCHRAKKRISGEKTNMNSP